MAITQDVQDLNNYPGTIKRITLDVDTVVPTGAEGDEKMMLTASTTAYSDNDARTDIQTLYVAGAKIGWSKSNGLAGAAGKFAVTSTAYKLGISMDATVSGTYQHGGRGCYEIDLANNDTTLISGDDVAADMQAKIRAITCETADAGFQLAYTNCSVSFTGGKFVISSGSIANSYTDDDRSSVYVAPGQTMDVTQVLGFENQLTSEAIAGMSVAEAYITQDYTTDTATLYIGTGTGVATGDALYISDGTNWDYFTAVSVSGTQVTVATNGTNNFTGIANSYTVANGSYIQVLRKQDPDVKPNDYYADMDGLLRYMSKILVNQIDFSS
jgi:hypothetical protein